MKKVYQAFKLNPAASGTFIGGIDFGPTQFVLQPVGGTYDTREEAEENMPRPTVKLGEWKAYVVLEILLFHGEENKK